MYTIKAEIEKVCEEFPQTKKWLKNVHKKILNKEMDLSKVAVYYSYGFFVTKGKPVPTNEEIFGLKYKKRLRYELEKVRVNVYFEIGTFKMTVRLDNGLIPKDILDVVTELTKVRMLLEGEYHNNEKVIKSIPPVDTNIIQYKIIKEDGDVEVLTETFDIDKILDKISNEGIGSLTPEEKNFLDKKSGLQ